MALGFDRNQIFGERNFCEYEFEGKKGMKNKFGEKGVGNEEGEERRVVERR